MRIGMILDKTFPPDPRVENEAIALIEAGHQVFLFCLRYNNESVSELIYEIQVKRYLSNNVEYKLSALAYTFPFYSKVMSRKITHFLIENKIEAIHIHDIRIAEAVFKANANLNLPTVLDLHDNIPEVMKLYPHLRKFPGKVLISPKKWKQKEEEFIAKVNAVISVSDEFIDEVINRTDIDRSKIKLVPNTVRSSFYKDAKLNKEIIDRYRDNFVILYLGDTALRRGLQTAIGAVKELRSTISNLKLVIVGSSTTDSVLEKQVLDLDLDDFVDFEGWQDVQLFPSYILASDICISPLQRNVQHDVAYANKLFQYMSFAKPVLVSNAIAQKNLIMKIESGLIHQEKNSKDFTQKVLKLYNNSDLREELGQNGKDFIENEFVWEKVSKNLVDLYDELKKIT